jgi:hypothetical protein
LVLNGANGFGTTNPIPLVSGRSYRIEYTAMFPTGGTPRIRFEGAGTIALSNFPTGAVASGGHMLFDAPAVAAGQVFTHSITLTQAQLANIGARDMYLSASGNNDIVYGNIRIIQHTPPVMRTVTFSQSQLTATANGSAITSGAQVAQGSNIVFTATPPVGQRVSTWTVGGVVQTGQTANQFTHNNLQGPIIVAVTFVPMTYNVRFIVGDGITLEPDSASLNQTVTHGASASEPRATTLNGQFINGWSTTFNNVTSDIDVIAQWRNLGAISSNGAQNMTSQDITHLARAAAGQSAFALPSDRLRLGNLRGANRQPTSDDVVLMARWLVGFDLATLIQQTAP